MHGLRRSALTAVVGALLSVAILAVLARLLTPRDFGVLGIALIFVGVIDATGRLGIGPAIMQRPELTERHVATGFVLSAALGAVLSAAVWFASPAVGRFFADPEAPAILGGLSAVFVITGLGEVSQHLLRRQLRFGRLMLASLVSQAAGQGWLRSRWRCTDLAPGRWWAGFSRAARCSRRWSSPAGRRPCARRSRGVQPRSCCGSARGSPSPP